MAELERQLEKLGEEHQGLRESYSQQSDEVAKLTGKITEITCHINALKSCVGRTFHQISSLDSFESFDAFAAEDEIVCPDHEICACFV